MCNETIQPPETNGTMFLLGPSLLGAEFVRGRVCQGPSLSGAEMFRNPPATTRPLHLLLRILKYWGWGVGAWKKMTSCGVVGSFPQL